MTLSINARIHAWCNERGLEFKLWEVHPADAGNGPSPWTAGTGGAESWPRAQKLRRRIVAEIKAGRASDDRAETIGIYEAVWRTNRYSETNAGGAWRCRQTNANQSLQG